MEITEKSQCIETFVQDAYKSGKACVSQHQVQLDSVGAAISYLQFFHNSTSNSNIQYESTLTAQQSEHALFDSFEASSQSQAQLPLHPTIKAAFAEYNSGTSGYACVPVDWKGVYLAPCVSNHMKVDEKLRRVHTLSMYEEVQAGVRELALPHVEFDALQQHLDNITQESATQAHITRWFKRSHQFVYDHIAYCTSPSREIWNDHAAAGTDTCCMEAREINKDGTSSNTTLKASTGDATGTGAAVVGGAGADGICDQLQLSGVGREGAGAPLENAAEAPMTLKVLDQSGEEMLFEVKTGTAMKKIMDESVNRKDLPPEVLCFMIDSTRVNAEDTPKMLEMEDGDQIDVLLPQLGGGDEAGGTPDARGEGNVPQRVGNAPDASTTGHAQAHTPTATLMSSSTATSTATSTIDPSASSSPQCLRLKLPREGSEEELQLRLKDYYDTSRTSPTTQCSSTSPTLATSSTQLIPQPSSSAPSAAHEGHQSPSQINRSRSASGTEGDVSEESGGSEEEEERMEENKGGEEGADASAPFKNFEDGRGEEMTPPISPLPVSSSAPAPAPAADPEGADNSVKLRGYCQVLGLDTSGTERELLERLQAHALARHALASQEHQPHSQVGEGGESEVSDSEEEEEEEGEEGYEEEGEEGRDESGADDTLYDDAEEWELEDDDDLRFGGEVDDVWETSKRVPVAAPYRSTSGSYYTRLSKYLEFTVARCNASFPCEGHMHTIEVVAGECSVLCGECGERIPLEAAHDLPDAPLPSEFHKLYSEAHFTDHQLAEHGRLPQDKEATFCDETIQCPTTLPAELFVAYYEQAVLLRSMSAGNRVVTVVSSGTEDFHFQCQHCSEEWPVTGGAIPTYVNHICATAVEAPPDLELGELLVHKYNISRKTQIIATSTFVKFITEDDATAAVVECGLCAALGRPDHFLLAEIPRDMWLVAMQRGMKSVNKHNELFHPEDEVLTQRAIIIKLAEVQMELNRPPVMRQKKPHHPSYDVLHGNTEIDCGCCGYTQTISMTRSTASGELVLRAGNFKVHLDKYCKQKSTRFLAKNAKKSAFENVRPFIASTSQGPITRSGGAATSSTSTSATSAPPSTSAQQMAHGGKLIRFDARSHQERHFQRWEIYQLDYFATQEEEELAREHLYADADNARADGITLAGFYASDAFGEVSFDEASISFETEAQPEGDASEGDAPEGEAPEGDASEEEAAQADDALKPSAAESDPVQGPLDTRQIAPAPVSEASALTYSPAQVLYAEETPSTTVSQLPAGEVVLLCQPLTCFNLNPSTGSGSGSEWRVTHISSPLCLPQYWVQCLVPHAGADFADCEQVSQHIAGDSTTNTLCPTPFSFLPPDIQLHSESIIATAILPTWKDIRMAVLSRGAIMVFDLSTKEEKKEAKLVAQCSDADEFKSIQFWTIVSPRWAVVITTEKAFTLRMPKELVPKKEVNTVVPEPGVVPVPVIPELERMELFDRVKQDRARPVLDVQACLEEWILLVTTPVATFTTSRSRASSPPPPFLVSVYHVPSGQCVSFLAMAGSFHGASRVLLVHSGGTGAAKRDQLYVTAIELDEIRKHLEAAAASATPIDINAPPASLSKVWSVELPHDATPRGTDSIAAAALDTTSNPAAPVLRVVSRQRGAVLSVSLKALQQALGRGEVPLSQPAPVQNPLLPSNPLTRDLPRHRAHVWGLGRSVYVLCEAGVLHQVAVTGSKIHHAGAIELPLPTV